MNGLQLANFSFNLFSMLNKLKIKKSLNQPEVDFLVGCGFATKDEEDTLILSVHGNKMLKHLEGLASMKMENPFFLEP